jgi:hypothetical protein
MEREWLFLLYIQGDGGGSKYPWNWPRLLKIRKLYTGDPVVGPSPHPLEKHS